MKEEIIRTDKEVTKKEDHSKTESFSEEKNPDQK